MNFEIDPPDEPCPDCGSTKHRACPVTAREDQPQLGTCDSRSELHEERDTCVNWRLSGPTWEGWRLADGSSHDYKTIFFGIHAVACNVQKEYAEQIVKRMRPEDQPRPTQSTSVIPLTG